MIHMKKATYRLAAKSMKTEQKLTTGNRIKSWSPPGTQADAAWWPTPSIQRTSAESSHWIGWGTQKPANEVEGFLGLVP